MSSRGHHGLLLAGGNALWSPADLAVAPKLWLDWGSPITDVSGACSSWDNTKGSLGGSFTQATSGSRPAINAAAVGGKRALEFDGADDFLAQTSGPLMGLYRNIGSGWLFAVMAQRSTAAGQRHILEAATGNHNVRFGVVGNSSDPGAWGLAGRRLDSDSANALWSTDKKNDTDFHFSYSQINYSAGTALVNVDGGVADTASSFLSTGSTSNIDSPRIRIGASSTVTPSVGFVSVAAIIASSGGLPSAGERQKLEGWAAWQLGLVANLPGGHPYKSAPPTV